MGRIKTLMIKRMGNKIFKEYSDNFSKDFNKNKEKVEEVADIPSKKLRIFCGISH